MFCHYFMIIALINVQNNRVKVYNSYGILVHKTNTCFGLLKCSKVNNYQHISFLENMKTEYDPKRGLAKYLTILLLKSITTETIRPVLVWSPLRAQYWPACSRYLKTSISCVHFAPNASRARDDLWSIQNSFVHYNNILWICRHGDKAMALLIKFINILRFIWQRQIIHANVCLLSCTSSHTVTIYFVRYLLFIII